LKEVVDLTTESRADETNNRLLREDNLLVFWLLFTDDLQCHIGLCAIFCHQKIFSTSAFLLPLPRLLV